MRMHRQRTPRSRRFGRFAFTAAALAGGCAVAAAQDFDLAAGGAARGVSPATVAAIPGVALATSGSAGGGQVYAPASPNSVRAWTSVFGLYSRVGADARAPAFTSRASGITIGVDRYFDPTLLMGVTLSYTHSTTSSIGVASDVNNVAGAAYAIWTPLAGLELSGLIGGNASDIHTSRLLTLGGVGVPLRGEAGGVGLNAAASAAYKFGFTTSSGEAYVKPFVAVGYSNLDRRGYSETGTGGIALVFDSQNFERSSVTAGLANGIDLSIGAGWTLRPELRLAWSRYLTDPAPAVIASLGGVPMVIREPEPGRDAGVVGVEVVAWNTGQAQLFAGYVGEFRSNAQTHLARGGLRVSW
jgi:outer membrane autotransporter protein